MNKLKILVLNVDISGMNKFLFASLEEHGFELVIENSPIKRIMKYWTLAKTVNFNLDVWRDRFDWEYWRYYYTPEVFRLRTKANEKIIAKHRNTCDCILQLGTVFAPSFVKLEKPYFVFTSWTTRLSDREWPEWNTLKDRTKYSRWEEQQSFLYDNARMIFVSNRYVVESLLNDYGIPPEKIKVVGYGPPIPPLPDMERCYDARTILFIGYQFDRKGGRYLLEAFEKLKKEFPNARLIIIGPPKIESTISGIDFRGIVRERRKIEEAYREASVFVMPSLCEPFGLTFLEAMSYRLPCIGTTNDAMPEIIEDGVTGYTVPPANSEVLAKKIIQLLRDKEKIVRMGENGYKRLTGEFTWEKVARNIEEELNHLALTDKT